ncbi:MAG: exonuclease domain-containing protein [Candidatus Omnitrophota bacterium]
MLIKEATFTVFDFETTGLFPYAGDRICEIGAIRVDLKAKTRREFHAMVDPGRPISYGAFLVNRITEDMVQGAPKISEALPVFMEFIKDSVLVAYNAGFDIGFLEYALGEDEKNALKDYQVIDALKLARKLFPGLPSYGLGNVARSLRIRPQKEHRAISDAAMTLEIFQREANLLIKQGARRIDDIIKAQPRKKKLVRKVEDFKTKMIEKAIREQEKLDITYRSSWNNKVTKRTITPQQLQEGYDKLYVVAYCHTKKGRRNFRMDGILEAEPEKDS